jgi:hypothetical protein
MLVLEDQCIFVLGLLLVDTLYKYYTPQWYGIDQISQGRIKRTSKDICNERKTSEIVGLLRGGVNR